jgi:hypothetical protein
VSRYIIQTTGVGSNIFFLQHRNIIKHLIMENYRIGHRMQLAVRLVMVYVLASYALLQILFLVAWCRPFKQYWALPVQNGI